MTQLEKEVSQMRQPGEPLQEEAIKRVLTDLLTKDGWDVQTAWGHQLGADIDARKGGKRWILEVKGPGKANAESKYFDNILGEILRRMDDPAARYSIVLPDKKEYRDRWEKLPRLAKERTTIGLLLVDGEGKVSFLT